MKYRENHTSIYKQNFIYFINGMSTPSISIVTWQNVFFSRSSIFGVARVMRAVSQIPSNHRNIRHKLHQNRPKHQLTTSPTKTCIIFANKGKSSYQKICSVYACTSYCQNIFLLYITNQRLPMNIWHTYLLSLGDYRLQATRR